MSCRHGKKISILLLSILFLNTIFTFNVDVARADSSNVVTIYPNGKSKNIINRMFNLNNDNDDSLLIGDTRLTYDVDYDNNNIDINFEDEIFIDDVVSEGDTIHNTIRFNDDELIEVNKELKTEGFFSPSVRSISLNYVDVASVESVTLIADDTNEDDWIGLLDSEYLDEVIKSATSSGANFHGSLTDVYDNDISSYIRFGRSSGYTGGYVSSRFKVPMNISFIRIKSKDSSAVVFHTYDVFGNISPSIDLPANGYIDVSDNDIFQNVTIIDIESMKTNSGRYSNYLYEIEFYGEPSDNVFVFKLNVFSDSNMDSIDFDFDIKGLSDDDVFKINIYRDDELIVENYEELSYIDEGLYYSTSYDYRFELIVNDEIVDTVEKTIVTLDRDQPVLNVTDLTGYYDVLMSFKIDNLLKDDIYKFNIYRDDELIVENYEELTYKDEDLEVDTDYEYYIELIINDEIVDTQRFVSRTKYIDIVPPAIPTGLTADVGNGFSALRWNHVGDDDLAGYNIYLNGEKVNIDLVKTNRYVMYGLENDIEYSVSVSAVDDAGNESERSEEYIFVCDSEGMPLVYVGVNVKDVSDGVSSIFSDLWPLIAFLVAVPIAFYISRGIKQLLV